MKNDDKAIKRCPFPSIRYPITRAMVNIPMTIVSANTSDISFNLGSLFKIRGLEANLICRMKAPQNATKAIDATRIACANATGSAILLGLKIEMRIIAIATINKINNLYFRLINCLRTSYCETMFIIFVFLIGKQ